MIVWINGAFASGKTTLVKELRSRRPNAVVFDPEHIGHMLRARSRYRLATFRISLAGARSSPLRCSQSIATTLTCSWSE